jgi:hypothetical protein
MNHFSVVQNFVCNHEQRLEVIRRNTKKLGDVFDECEFFVNFNSDKNLEEVKDLYLSDIPNINFYNNLERDWALVTLALVKEVKTPYTIYLCEDIEVTSPKEDVLNFVNEMINDGGDLGFVGKIDKYTQQKFIEGLTPFNSIKSPGYKKLEHSYFYLGKHAPHKRIPVDSVFKTDWLIGALEEFLVKGESCTHDIPFRSKHLPNFYEGYYDFANGMRRFGDWKCYIPQKVIFKEYDDVKDKA